MAEPHPDDYRDFLLAWLLRAWLFRDEAERWFPEHHVAGRLHRQLGLHLGRRREVLFRPDRHEPGGSQGRPTSGRRHFVFRPSFNRRIPFPRSKTMIVTIVTDVLGEANNGTTIAAMHLINSLTEKGHTVRVLCPEENKKGVENYYVVPTINFGVFQPIVDHNGVSLAKGDPMTVARAIHDADEVHIMMPFALGRKAAQLCAEFGKPVSAGFHVQAENVTAHFFNWMGNTAINKAVYRNFWNHFYKYIDAIHYPTQFIRDEFESVIKRKTPGYVISNGVSSDFVHKDVKRLPELEGKFVILCTGRYSKEKRQALLIKAAKASKYSDEIRL